MDREIYQLAEALGQALLQKGWQVAVAESCTGGAICQALTDVPGSSRWFDRGFVTYSNVSKTELLGVKPQTLEAYGAVSAETAAEMAQGALLHSQAGLAAAVTGIAGPTGAVPGKPVGTVFIALAAIDRQIVSDRAWFEGDRAAVRQATRREVLQRLLAWL